MQHIENLVLSSAEVIEESSILIFFNSEWQQDNIHQLAKLVFAQLPGAMEIERVQGADRESIRIQWQQGFFVLNFECYSQSCWLEAEDEASRENLGLLHLQLVNN